MKNIIIKTLAATAIAVSFTAPASAMVTSQDVAAQINSSYTSGNVNVRVDGSTATLFGWVGDAGDRQAVASAAAKVPGIDTVINRVSDSN